MRKKEITGPQPFVNRMTVYISPDGELIVSIGNQRIECSPEEASSLLDYLLQYATKFHGSTLSNGNGHVPLPDVTH